MRLKKTTFISIIMSKRTPMDLYRERKEANKCVRCGTEHNVGWNLKKCEKCRTNESNYRKRTRNDARKAQEKEYQRKNWFNRCIYLSRQSDNRKNRTSDKKYITGSRLRALRVLQDNKCFYCNIVLQINNRKRHDGLTIERLVNSEPHTISNVILCCSRCNCKRVSDHLTQSTAEVFSLICNRFLENDRFIQFVDTLDVNPVTVEQ